MHNGMVTNLWTLALAAAGCHGGVPGTERAQNAVCAGDANCEAGLTCSDRACRMPCTTSVDCSGAACVAGGCRAEACNFIDDDGNGEVDEGFDWVVDPWLAPVFEGAWSAGYPQLRPLSNGLVALTASDGEGGGHDRVATLLLRADGTVAAGPVFTSPTIPGVEETSIVEGPEGEFAIAISTTDWGPTCAACTTPLVRRSTADLRELGSNDIAFGFPPRGATDLAWSAGSYVVVVGRGTPRGFALAWTRDGTTVTRVLSLPAGADQAGVIATPQGLIWVKGADTGDLSVGGLLSNDASPSFGPVSVTSSAYETVNVPRQLARVGAATAVVWGERDALNRTMAGAAVVDDTGKVIAKRSLSSLGERAPAQVIGVAGNLVVVGADNATTNRLIRLRSDLTDVRTPGSRLEFGVGSQHVAIAHVGDHLLVVRGSGTDDARSLRVARVHCP